MVYPSSLFHEDRDGPYSGAPYSLEDGSRSSLFRGEPVSTVVSDSPYGSEVRWDKESDGLIVKIFLFLC